MTRRSLLALAPWLAAGCLFRTAGGSARKPWYDPFAVFGSSPDAGLAAEYGRSLGATYALTGIYREDGGSRRLEVTLVDVGTGAR